MGGADSAAAAAMETAKYRTTYSAQLVKRGLLARSLFQLGRRRLPLRGGAGAGGRRLLARHQVFRFARVWRCPSLEPRQTTFDDELMMTMATDLPSSERALCRWGFQPSRPLLHRLGNVGEPLPALFPVVVR